MTNVDVIKTKQEAVDILKSRLTSLEGIDFQLAWIAIDAIEQQIPKEPEKRIEYSTNTDFSKDETLVAEYYCRNCNKRIYVSENFCTQCGQNIDWSNEDDKL